MPRLTTKHDTYYYMQFEPDRFLSDDALCLCSAQATGVWIKILCRMWSSKIRGTLTGDVTQLSRLTGFSEREVSQSIEELESNGVFIRGEEVGENLDPDCIVNKKMYREWKLLIDRKDAGRRGGEAGKNESKARPGNQNAARKINADENAKTQANASKNANNASKTQANEKSEVAYNTDTYDTSNASKTQAKRNIIRDRDRDRVINNNSNSIISISSPAEIPDELKHLPRNTRPATLPAACLPAEVKQISLQESLDKLQAAFDANGYSPEELAAFNARIESQNAGDRKQRADQKRRPVFAPAQLTHDDALATIGLSEADYQKLCAGNVAAAVDSEIQLLATQAIAGKKIRSPYGLINWTLNNKADRPKNERYAAATARTGS